MSNLQSIISVVSQPLSGRKDGQEKTIAFLSKLSELPTTAINAAAAKAFLDSTDKEVDLKYWVGGYPSKGYQNGGESDGPVTSPMDYEKSPAGYFQTAIGKKATKENLLTWYAAVLELSEGNHELSELLKDEGYKLKNAEKTVRDIIKGLIELKNSIFTIEEQNIHNQLLEAEKEFYEINNLFDRLGFENIQVINKTKRQVQGVLRDKEKTTEAFKAFAAAFGVQPDIKLKLSDQKLGDTPSIGWKTNVVETTQDSGIPGMPTTKVLGFGSASVYITVPVGFKLIV